MFQKLHRLAIIAIMNDYNNIIKATFKTCLSNQNGNLASYIPELAKVDPNLFAISMTTVDGQTFSTGNVDHIFTLQSTSKPFTYGLSLKLHGPEFVHSKVGVEPTGEAFNSIIELEKDTHRPFNPMINSGAIAIANFIKDPKNPQYFEHILNFFSKMAGRSLDYNKEVFESEKKTAHRNRAIAHLLRHFEVIDDHIEETLDLYFKQCSINVNINDLSTMAATLANRGHQPKTKESIFTPDQCKRMISLMFTCGMYDTAGTWAYTIGVPCKSGVSGAIFGVIPNRFGIACYSPLIDSHGHSLRSIDAITEITKQLNLNIFN
jgi:glutaminase